MTKKRKRIVSKILIATIMLTGTLFYAHTDGEVYAVTKTSQGAIFITYSATSNINSLKIQWKKRANVKKWVIYRADITDIVQSDFSKDADLSRYKKIKKLSGKTTSFVDKKVKRHHYYEYLIEGYKKSNGKYKLAYSTYLGEVPGEILSFDCPGLSRPDLLNGGTGEDYSNSSKKIYLYVEPRTGMDPRGVVVYRKDKNETKYKKIKVKKVEKGKFSPVYLDTNVKSGMEYRYKVKTYRKVGKKKYYSKASKPVAIIAAKPIIDDDL